MPTKLSLLILFAAMIPASANPGTESGEFTDAPLKLEMSGASRSRHSNFIFPDCLLCSEEKKAALADARWKADSTLEKQCARGKLVNVEVFNQGCEKHDDFGYPIGFLQYYFSCTIKIQAVCRTPRLKLSGPAFDALESGSGVFENR